MWYGVIMLLCMLSSTLFVSYCFLFNKWEFNGYYKEGNVENLISYLFGGLGLSIIWPLTMFLWALTFAHGKLEKRREKKKCP